MDTKNKYILMIDDDSSYLETRKKWLEEVGYEVSFISSLEGGFEYIEDYYADTQTTPWVLLDIMMPTIDDIGWLSVTEQSNDPLVFAPTIGLLFAKKLKDKYPNIRICWHSVRYEKEPQVKKMSDKLKFTAIQKSLQNKDEFIQQVKKGFNSV
jgi:CheY-like chemotaxis protein